jgi:hypothetical protein
MAMMESAESGRCAKWVAEGIGEHPPLVLPPSDG